MEIALYGDTMSCQHARMSEFLYDKNTGKKIGAYFNKSPTASLT